MDQHNARPKILIVDDVSYNLLSLRRIMGSLDVDVFEAQGGAEALALTLEYEFALVLLDVQMPEMDGYETATLMRGAEHTKHTPIIFVTANSRELVHELRGYESGAVDYITKPINRSILLSKIAIFTELYRQKEHLQNINHELVEARKIADQANEMKARFLANMSHEIRTPMNGVIGMIELMLHTELTEKQKKYTATAYKCGQDLITLINDILDYSKIEAGELQLAPEDFDLHEFMKETLMPLEVLAKKNEVTLAVEDKMGEIGLVFGDIYRIRQVINNLMSNAIKFSPKGNITLRLLLEGKMDGMVTVRIEVQDTGIGIPKDKQHLLFQKFSQVEASTTKKYGGTGLGLAICKSLVEIMGGTIGVESEEGKGSTFWFTLPMEEQVEGRQRYVPDSNARVLFVGINSTNTYVFSEYVERLSLPFAEAETISQAVELLYQEKDSPNPYTTVIVGEDLPEQSRLTLAHALKNDPDFRNITLLFVSGFGLNDQWEKYKKVGFARNLVLPVSQENLLGSLRHA